MTHYTLLQLPHGALNPLLSSRWPHQDAGDTLPPGPTAGLAICAVIPHASPADEHPDAPSQSVYESASEDTTLPYTREYVADLRRQLDEAEGQLVELRGDEVRVRDEQAELDALRIQVEHARDEQERVQEEQVDRISELTWEVSVRDARIRELNETNARLETSCATLAASRDRLSDVVDELSAERANLEYIVEERQQRVDELERQNCALEASNTERQEQIQALQASTAELESAGAALKDKMKKAVRKYKELMEEKDTLEARVTALTASNDERAARIASLEAQLRDLKAADVTSKQRIEQLEKYSEEKEHAIAQLRHELAVLTAVVEEVKSENAGLTEENASLTAANRELKSRMDDLEAERAELGSLRLEKARADAVISGLEFALANKEGRLAQLDATVTSLSGQLEARKSEEAEARVEMDATNEQVAALLEEREVLTSQLADALFQIEALREPPLASDDDIASVLSEINQAMQRIAEDIAANVMPIASSPDESSATRGVCQLTPRLRARLGPSLYAALTQGDVDARRAVLSHALRAILAHWVRGVVGRWSLTDDEENLALRRMYEKIVENYDPQVAGKWRSLALRVSARAEDTLCAALESSLLESLAAVLTSARFERGPREDAETLDALVESLVWKVVELREHIGVVVTDRELALVLPRPGDRFDEATMQVTPATSVAPLQEVEGDSEKGRAGGCDAVDESNEGDLVAEWSSLEYYSGNEHVSVHAPPYFLS
uniref:Uncharacterized protein n=1 Tax=Schizophyllum commune (strain H4-8 / FGSC 9210) TaxID=578458 RepID=D8PYB3_SCHCM